MTQQLLREWPPGYGGVERVAHELANVWGGTVFSLDVQGQAPRAEDPLTVTYPRQRLPCFPAMGRLLLPRPSWPLWRLLRSPEPLHGHLPSPGVLLILLIARLVQPKRRVTAHWHCFLEPTSGWSDSLFAFYQSMALGLLPWASEVITTSPLLADELRRRGCRADRLQVLPCCLSESQEQALLALPTRTVTRRMVTRGMVLRVLFIGRLDSYKRLDWLLEDLSRLDHPWELKVVGDGPKRRAFEALALELGLGAGPVRFLGRLSEDDKLKLLEWACVLVLPSDRSNEAFGIVQLEAMAAGIPALAFKRPRSGMGWVGQLPGLAWSQSPEDLPQVLRDLAAQPALRIELGTQARQRYLRLFARRIWTLRLERFGATNRER